MCAFLASISARKADLRRIEISTGVADFGASVPVLGRTSYKAAARRAERGKSGHAGDFPRNRNAR